MRTRTLTASLLVALLLTAAGCSSDSTAPGPATAGGGAATSTGSGGGGSANQASLPQCPTSAALSTALGITFGDLVQSSQAKERNCAYGSAGVETGPATVSFQILAGTGDFPAVKAGYSAGRTVADVSGLGDEAFSSTLNAGPSPKNTVGARKGLLMVLVSSLATVDSEKALIATLLG